ncbi:OmpA family protein [Vibrio sp. ZSDE26]|uniref:OmpA family protein n=1 Tax=Vibrio amylolyticus TaxID=2847292 RepID=A0A9X1XIF2_9VIBR|nr:OmpA family protein [Vibrio amylolyticus]MCK6263371.1 OmpA family protein [Vibrio amylolyticus]
MKMINVVILAAIGSLPLHINAKPIQKPLDQVSWNFSGDRFHCQMETPLEFDGNATVLVRSGQQPRVTLKTFQRPYFVDSAWLSINDEPWKKESLSYQWIEGRTRGAEELIFQDSHKIKSLLNKMEKGAWAQVSARYSQHQDVKTWELPAIHFSESLQEMKTCMSNLLPMDYPQAKDNLFHFPLGSSELSLQQKLRIADVASYIHYDDTIGTILIDGHTDDSGNSLNNLGLARERAKAVKAELKKVGVDTKKIQVRAHGQRFPLKANTNESNREQNRRVQVRIVKSDNTGRDQA